MNKILGFVLFFILISANAYCVPIPIESFKDISQQDSYVQQTNADHQNVVKQLINKTPEKEVEQLQNVEPQKNVENTVQTKISQDKIDANEDLSNQAKLLYNTNNLADSLAVYSKIPDAEKTSEDWLILGNISLDNEKPIDAIFFFKKAIEVDDKNYKAHYNLGNIYYSDNKFNMALKEYTKAIKIKKDFAYAYYNRGCCYLKKESWFNARYEFGLAIKSNPDEPVFYYNLAYTNKKMKRDKKAQEALEMYNKLMMQ